MAVGPFGVGVGVEVPVGDPMVTDSLPLNWNPPVPVAVTSTSYEPRAANVWLCGK